MTRILTTALAAAVATPFFGAGILLVRWLGLPGAGFRHASIQRRWARAVLLGAGVRIELEGGRHLRGPRSRVVVANHSSLFDILALASVLSIPYSWVMKEELGRIPLFGSALRAAGHIMIDRSDTESAVRSLRRMNERMGSEPLTVLMFPEGTRSRTGELQRFKRGASMLALRSGAELVPAAISGSFGVKPKGVWRINPAVVRIRLGEPISTAGMGVEERGALTELARERVKALLARTGPRAEPRADDPVANEPGTNRRAPA